MADFEFKEVTTMDDVPSKYHGLYVASTNDKDEEVFILIDGAKGIVGDYLGSVKSLGSARSDKKNASDESAKRRQALKAFDEMADTMGLEIGDEGVAESISAFIADLQSKVKGGEEVKVNLDKIRDEWQKRLEDAVSEKDKEVAERDGALSRHLIGERAAVALTAAKAKGPDLLLPHIKGATKVVREENGNYTVRVIDEQGDVRTAADGSWMTIDGLIEEMKGNPTFQPAFESEEKPGTGSNPGDMKRPTPKKVEEMSSTQKIRAGLDKGQHKQFG